MKAWFVFLINGKQIGTWANNTDEARANLKNEYGNIDMKYIGIQYDGIGPKADEYLLKAMSLCDRMISSGMLRVAARCAK